MEALTKTFMAPTGHAIRSTLIDGEPWFVAADVCRALGMDVWAGTTQWMRGLESADKRALKRRDHPELFSGTTAPVLNAINEGGVYELASRSNKPDARAFSRWVNHEVLPSIRKTGGYRLADHGRTEMPLPADFATALREMAQAQVQLGERVAQAMEELKAIFAQANPPKQDERMRTARQLLAMGVVQGVTSPALGRRLTAYCLQNGIPMDQVDTDYGVLRAYPVYAAQACFA